MANLEKPIFTEVDGQKVLNEIVAYYESLTGVDLSPAAPERLVLNDFAYRETLIRNAIQYAGEQCLVDFATAPALDSLGTLVGVVRLSATAASCTLLFTVSAGHPGVVIPEGTRVQTNDQQVVFVTLENLEIETGQTSGQVAAEAETDGASGNGYLIGSVNIILDPQAFVVSASNIATTAGGSEEENDESLRSRILLAPGSYSTAGPTDAYIFHAKSAHPSVIDVFVTSLSPGNVTIYPLVDGGGATPQPILDRVFEVCNSEKIRPLTDSVDVFSPASVNYSITCYITVLEDASTDFVLEEAQKQLEFITLDRSKKLGRNLLKNQLTSAILQIQGAYDCNFPGFSDVIIGEDSVAICSSINVSITGITNG